MRGVPRRPRRPGLRRVWPPPSRRSNLPTQKPTEPLLRSPDAAALQVGAPERPPHHRGRGGRRPPDQPPLRPLGGGLGRGAGTDERGAGGAEPVGRPQRDLHRLHRAHRGELRGRRAAHDPAPVRRHLHGGRHAAARHLRRDPLGGRARRSSARSRRGSTSTAPATTSSRTSAPPSTRPCAPRARSSSPQESLRNTQERLADAQANLAAGTGTQFDVLTAQRDVADAQGNLVNARGGVTIALAQLKNTMGIDVSTPIAISDAGAVEDPGTTGPDPAPPKPETYGTANDEVALGPDYQSRRRRGGPHPPRDPGGQRLRRRRREGRGLRPPQPPPVALGDGGLHRPAELRGLHPREPGLHRPELQHPDHRQRRRPAPESARRRAQVAQAEVDRRTSIDAGDARRPDRLREPPAGPRAGQGRDPRRPAGARGVPPRPAPRPRGRQRRAPPSRRRSS